MHDTATTRQKRLLTPTELRRALAERVQGALFALLLLFGAWQGLAALWSAPAQHRLSSVLDLSALWGGKTAATVNFVEAHYLPGDHFLRAAGGILRWRIFGSGGPMVSIGCQDWLYLTEEGQTFDNAASHLVTRAQIVSQVAATLKKRGIELVVAVVPDKANIENATLCNAPRSNQAHQRYGAFMDLLRERNVSTVDLARVFRDEQAGRPLYYRTDTHWNQDGAALAAKTIAAAVKTSLDPGFQYRTDREAAASDGPGDLLKLMSLDLAPDTIPLLGVRLRPRPDRQFLEHTVEVDRPKTTDDLLAAGPGDQVVLLGSSFSKNANFQGRLQETLRSPVNNLAELGGGFALAANKYFHGNAMYETPPRVIVWEMPARVLTKPLDETESNLAKFR